MQFRKFKIPRLILQPVVENYLKHGYEVSDGAGELYIRFSVEPDCIVILVGEAVPRWSLRRYRRSGISWMRRAANAIPVW